MSGEVCLLCSSNIFLTILAAILWLVIIGFVFIGLAIVADDFLVPSLEKITEYCDIPENVATAVFLAFGSAVPEIMTSVVSTIQGKVDASLPAILGSGCIAYALIPPVCVLAIQPIFMSIQDRKSAKSGSDVAKFYRSDPYSDARARRGSEVARERRQSLVVELSRTTSGTTVSRTASGTVTRSRSKSVLKQPKPGKTLPLRLVTMPLLRDVVTYLVSLGLCMYFMDDTMMSLHESCILVGLYIAYLFVLIYFKSVWEEDDDPGKETSAREPLIDKSEKDAFVISSTKDETDKTGSSDTAKDQAKDQEDSSHAPADENDMQSIAAESLREGLPGATSATQPDIEAGEAPTEPNEAPASSEAEEEAAPTVSSEPAPPLDDTGAGESASSTEGSHTGSGSGADAAQIESAINSAAGDAPDTEEEGESTGELIMLTLSFPFYWLYEKTIPDCSDDEYEDYFVVTFVISLVYIAVLAMATLSLVTQLCLTLGIPDSLSGVTLIALGAEIPDAIGSIALAKSGMGPSAVSNCLNSQIINLLIGLGFPYMLHSMINGKAMQLGAEGSTQMFIGGWLASLVMVFLLLTVGETCWNGKHAQLTVNGGATLLVLYVIMVGAVTYWNYEVEGSA